MSWPGREEVLGSVLFSPLMALAVWPVCFFILPLVALMWWAWRHGWTPSPGVYILAGALAGGDLTFHREPWGLAFFLGSTVAGLIANLLILLLFEVPKRCRFPGGIVGGTPSAGRGQIL